MIDGGYIEGNVYHYYLTDHLGNNRVVVNASGTLVQKNHYYPFGSIFAGTTGPDKQPYKYNGKELDLMHGLNLYDYSARYYESAVGRFTCVDPHAEKYYSISPYAYCYNNPLRFVDKDGRDPGDPPSKNSSKMEKLQNIASQYSENSPKVFKGSSVSASISAFKAGIGVKLGPVVEAKANLKLLNAEAKYSDKGPEVTVSGLQLSGGLGASDLQIGGKVTALEGNASLDENDNTVSKTTLFEGKAQAKIGDNTTISTSDASTFGIAASLSVLSVNLLVNTVEAGKTLLNIYEYVMTAITPTPPKDPVQNQANNK